MVHFSASQSRAGAHQNVWLSRSAALGMMINISGRQRMLSHRFLMFLALVRKDMPDQARERLVASAKAALADFANGRGILVDGDAAKGLPPLFSSRAKALLYSPADPIEPNLTGLGLIDKFTKMGQACILRIERDSLSVENELLSLSSLTAGDLLVFLNKLVSAFEGDLAEEHDANAAKSQELRRIIIAMIENIERLGVNINLIAYSAIVEAARAGDAGKTFAIIANEIKMLSAETRTEAAKIGKAVGQLFGSPG